MLKLIILVSLGLVYSLDTKAFFDQLAQDEFGQTVIEAIQLNLHQEINNVGKVVNFLKTMQGDIQSDQQDHTTKYSEKKNTCSAKIEEVGAVIQKSKQQIAEDQRQLPLKNEELEDKQEQVEGKNKEKQRNLDRIAQLVAERKETRKEYEQRRDELIGMIAALQQAKQIIGEMGAQTAFAEIDSHHKSFMRHYPQKRGFNSMISLLLEVAKDPAVDGKQVNTVVQIIQDLLESLFELQKQEMQADDAKELAFQKSKARFEMLNTFLESSMADLVADVQNLIQKLLEFNNDIAIQSQIVEVKTSEKQDWIKICKYEETSFKSATQNRNSHMSIIAQTIDIFEKEFTQETMDHISAIQLH